MCGGKTDSYSTKYLSKATSFNTWFIVVELHNASDFMILQTIIDTSISLGCADIVMNSHLVQEIGEPISNSS